MPSSLGPAATTRFLDAPVPIAFAHRGYAPDGGENSMAAFAAAVALGYRYLETDARVSADGVAIAFHDARLDRVTDGHGVVARRPWRELARARIGGREPIPRLVDVLAAWPDVFVNVDVKSDAAVAATVAAIRRAGAGDRVCLAAFNDARLGRLRSLLGPGVCTSAGPTEVAWTKAVSRAGPRAAGRLRGGVAARCLQVPPRLGRLGLVDRRLIDTAHAAGLAVHVWTVNERAEMIRLLDLGVDGLMSDRADGLRRVLQSRGQWPPER
ncbi:MAG: glycerophosphodiester phosphodiesterase family protein [bacterium]